MKALLELVLIAALLAGVQSSELPPEAKEQAARRLPQIAEASLPRETVTEAVALPLSGERGEWPRPRDERSLGVMVVAQSAIVVDRESGQVMFEKNADELRSVASLTKLMTALVFLEQQPNFSEKIIIIKEDLGGEVSTIFAEGDEVSLRDLLFAVMVGSANDAARALARASGLDNGQFVRRMNQKARELGLERTRFVEPTGLDARNVSTAREIARLLALAEEVPILREAAAQPVYRTGGSTPKSRFVRTTNLLLDGFLNHPPYRITFAKTGALDEAGFCFAAAFEEGEHGVIVVALGGETHFSRFEDVKSLAYWALTRWEWHD